MAAGRSFAEFVKNKCFDGLYEAAEKYVSENQDSLDLRTRHVSRIGEVEFVDATIQRVYVRDLPGMRVAFDVGFEMELCVHDANHRSDEIDECHPWLRICCEGDLSQALDDWSINNVEPYNPRGTLPLNSMSDALVPDIPKDRLETVATEFLKEYYPEALRTTPHGQPPISIDTTVLAQRLGLTILNKRIREDASVFGQLYFVDTEAELFDAKVGETVPTHIDAQTIVVDPMNFLLRNLSSVNNTIIHECVHWVKHRKVFELEKLYNADASCISCEVVGGAAAQVAKQATEQMERQANQLTPRIQMPAGPFKAKAQEYITRFMRETDAKHENEVMEKVIMALETDFCVSKQAAKIRLVELGIDEAIGTYTYLDNHYVKPHKFRKGSIRVIGIYAEEGISGTQAESRPQFMKMIADCRSGLIDCIWTKSVSRFGRNTVDTLIYTRELHSLGIDVYFEKENIHSTDSSGELMLTLMAAFAESESVAMSENIKWGKRRRFEQGLTESITINGMMGFRQNKGKVTIVDVEADIVRRIYKDFIDGYGYEEIAAKLSLEGIPTRTGKRVWDRNTVRNIILNEKYCGDCLFQKYYIADPITHKAVKNNGALPKYLTEDCLPPIIDKETWRLAQKVAEKHSKLSKAPNERYPFTGKLFCGVCGKPYYYYHYTTTNKQHLTAYRCVSRKNQSAVEVPGQIYTPPRKATFNRNASPELIAYRERYCKPPKERPMLCTDVRIPTDLPQKAFCRAWNLIVAKKLRYQATLRSTVDNAEDILVRYRAEEMYLLIDEIGKITEFSYSLMLKTLDRVVVNTNGKLSFIFQSGIKITV